MTADIALTLAILLAAIVLFVTEWVRVDLTALLVLSALALTGLVTPEEALSGFSNSAVVTVWAVFILSGGLTATGVADIVGRQVFRLSGDSETRLLVVLMITAGLLSGFMNNVGVAALMLPVAINLARQTQISPSKLLLPLAYSTLLGGMLTLIGTPPNILASDALANAGFAPFDFFDFTPMGIVLLAGGILFTLLVGRRLLPIRSPVETLDNGQSTPELYGLAERLATIRVPAGSALAGQTLAESRIGRALGLTILGLERDGQELTAIAPTTQLQEGDELLVLGRLDQLQTISAAPFFTMESEDLRADDLLSAGLGLAELTVSPTSPLNGRTIVETAVREQVGLNVLAMRHAGAAYQTNLQQLVLETGDTLLLQGDPDRLAALAASEPFGPDLRLIAAADDIVERYDLQQGLLAVRLPAGSPLEGQALSDSRLAAAYDMTVLAIMRGDERLLQPGADTVLQEGDLLWLEGRPQDLTLLRGLQTLEIEGPGELTELPLTKADLGLVEAVLAPRTTLLNKTLREVKFREKYGVSVLAIWRNGRAIRTSLGDLPLQLGDAFLLYGPQEQLALLAGEPDFVLLTREQPAAAHPEKAWIAALIMGAVILTVLIGWLPIAIAAVAGSALMVLTGCLTMDEAYHDIDWRAVYLIAGMLPLGIAMEQTGTAQYLADGMVALVGGLGPLALIAGFFIFTNLATQFIPSAVVAVLMAPIAIKTATDLGLSPYALVMTVAIAASASFMSPVGHPANVLVMGPGGYRFTDYIKQGLPLTLVVLILVLIFLPIFWPL